MGTGVQRSRSGPDHGNNHSRSGRGGGQQGSDPLTALGRARPKGCASSNTLTCQVTNELINKRSIPINPQIPTLMLFHSESFFMHASRVFWEGRSRTRSHILAGGALSQKVWFLGRKPSGPNKYVSASRASLPSPSAAFSNGRGLPPVPFCCFLQRPGPASNLLVPVPRAFNFSPAEPDTLDRAQGACTEAKETSDTEAA